MAAITITNAGLNMMRDGLSGATKPVISFVALGTSSTPATSADTKLGAETFRKSVTTYTNGSNPGEILINMYLAPGDDVGSAIQEVGFFGGSTAKALPNTGVLVAHGSYSHTKTNTESIQFQLDLTF